MIEKKNEREGRKEGERERRKEGKKEGKKEGRKEGKKERRKEGRKEGRKERRKEGRKKEKTMKKKMTKKKRKNIIIRNSCSLLLFIPVLVNVICRDCAACLGSVTHAIDRVLSGKNRNAFCIVRPPRLTAGTYHSS